MHALVANGPRQHPGANFVRRPDGSQINLKHVEEPENVRLDVGYVVERHIVDDDIVLFNRQPSLHKMSIMGHRVKVLPYVVLECEARDDLSFFSLSFAPVEKIIIHTHTHTHIHRLTGTPRSD